VASASGYRGEERRILHAVRFALPCGIDDRDVVVRVGPYHSPYDRSVARTASK
jgi:hypothetical protein